MLARAGKCETGSPAKLAPVLLDKAARGEGSTLTAGEVAALVRTAE